MKKMVMTLMFVLSMAFGDTNQVVKSSMTNEGNRESETEALLVIGNAFYSIQKYDKAIQMYKKAIEINPLYFEAYNNMGNVYGVKKIYGKAIDAFEKAIEINPLYYDAYCNMGITYTKEKMYSKAIDVYKKAIEINPKKDVAYIGLFELQLILNRDFDDEAKFKENFKENKEIFIMYEMFKILQSIHNNSTYELSLKEWSEKYKDISVNRWGWNAMDDWINKMKYGNKKDRLIELIKVFKNH